MVKPRKPARTTSKKKTTKKAVIVKPQKIGFVTHYFTNIKVAVVRLNKPLNKGDKIRIQSDTPLGLTNFAQTVTSLQHNHKNLVKALPGREIGMKVRDRVRQNDLVFKIK